MDPWKYVSCFPFLVAQQQEKYRPTKSGQQKSGNKRHNTRMLSRKLVLIFKALHYLRSKRVSQMQSKEEGKSEAEGSKRDSNNVEPPKSGRLNQVKLNQLFQSLETTAN